MKIKPVKTLPWALLILLSVLVSAQEARPRLRPLNEQSVNSKTGPGVGAHIPEFAAVDLNGKRQSFDSLKGPKGLVLVCDAKDPRGATWNQNGTVIFAPDFGMNGLFSVTARDAQSERQRNAVRKRFIASNYTSRRPSRPPMTVGRFRRPRL
jgi:hypothetical protein